MPDVTAIVDNIANNLGPTIGSIIGGAVLIWMVYSLLFDD